MMKLAAEPTRCALCDEGIAHPSFKRREIGEGVFCVTEFSVCDYCTTVHANRDQVTANLEHYRKALEKLNQR